MPCGMVVSAVCGGDPDAQARQHDDLAGRGYPKLVAAETRTPRKGSGHDRSSGSPVPHTASKMTISGFRTEAGAP